MGFFDRFRRFAGRPSSGQGFRMEVFGEVVIDRAFTAGAARAMDLRPAFHEIHDWLLEENRKQFDSEGAYASGGWTPLSPATVAEKQRLGMDNGILDRTGDLRFAMTHKGDPNTKVTLTKTTFTFEPKIPYGSFHQAGTSRMPARPPAAFTDAAKRVPMTFIQARIMDERAAVR